MSFFITSHRQWFFLWWIVANLQKIIWKHIILSQLSCFWVKVCPKMKMLFKNCQNWPKPPTTWNILKGFSTLIFWMLTNLTQYSYGWSPLGQHHKIWGREQGGEKPLGIDYKNHLHYPVFQGLISKIWEEISLR